MPIRQAVAAAVILNPRTGAQGGLSDSNYLAQERNASQKIWEDVQADLRSHCRMLLSPYKVDMTLSLSLSLYLSLSLSVSLSVTPGTPKGGDMARPRTTHELFRQGLGFRV
jgi:hypothetical protein